MPEDREKTIQPPQNSQGPRVSESLQKAQTDTPTTASGTGAASSPAPAAQTGVVAPSGQEASAQVSAPVAQVGNNYSFKKAFFLAFFLGIFGMDKFYLGYKQLGKIKAATLGGLLLWAYVDAVMILLGKTKAADGSPLSGRREHFKLALGVFIGVSLLVLILLLAVLPLYLWSA